MGTNAEKLYIECTACDASGVFKDSKDAKGVGVVCRDCNGSGKRAIDGVLFTERKTRFDTEFVFASKANLVTERNLKEAITYTEFLEGKLPPKGKM